MQFAINPDPWSIDHFTWEGKYTKGLSYSRGTTVWFKQEEDFIITNEEHDPPVILSDKVLTHIPLRLRPYIDVEDGLKGDTIEEIIDAFSKLINIDEFYKQVSHSKDTNLEIAIQTILCDIPIGVLICCENIDNVVSELKQAVDWGHKHNVVFQCI